MKAPRAQKTSSKVLIDGRLGPYKHGAMVVVAAGRCAMAYGHAIGLLGPDASSLRFGSVVQVLRHEVAQGIRREPDGALEYSRDLDDRVRLGLVEHG